jgi:glutamate racemase
VQVIDPSPAIARQTKRILHQHSLASSSKGKGELTFISSSDGSQLNEMARKLIGASGKRISAYWDDMQLVRSLDKK